MKAFDRLPRPIQRAIDEGLAKHDTTEILEAMYRFYIGTDEMLQIIRKTDQTLSRND